MAGKSPYSSELIEKCVTLWQKGVSVEDISKNTGIPIRTLHRWNKNHSSGKPIDPDTVSSDPNFQKALRAKPVPHNEAVCWIENVEATVSKLGAIHADLIDDLHELLKRAISSDEVSPRSVNTLSLCLDRHITSALKVALLGRDKLIDVNQAVSVLESYGYSVFDSARLKELFGGGDAPGTVENNETTDTYE